MERKKLVGLLTLVTLLLVTVGIVSAFWADSWFGATGSGTGEGNISVGVEVQTGLEVTHTTPDAILTPAAHLRDLQRHAFYAAEGTDYTTLSAFILSYPGENETEKNTNFEIALDEWLLTPEAPNLQSTVDFSFNVSWVEDVTNLAYNGGGNLTATISDVRIDDILDTNNLLSITIITDLEALNDIDGFNIRLGGSPVTVVVRVAFSFGATTPTPEQFAILAGNSLSFEIDFTVVSATDTP